MDSKKSTIPKQIAELSLQRKALIILSTPIVYFNEKNESNSDKNLELYVEHKTEARRMDYFS